MSNDADYVPALPEHPELREIALAIERMGMFGEILDHRFRSLFVSSQTARSIGLTPDEGRGLLGLSLIARTFDERFAEIIRVTPESALAWTRHNVPIRRRYVHPGDPDFEEIFGEAASYAAQVEPVSEVPRAWHDTVSFPPNLRFRRTWLGDQEQTQLRINDDAGRFIGVLYLYRGTLPESLLHRLGRGDPRLYERIERVSE